MDKFTAIEQAAHNGAFGNNPLPLPTDKQIQSGNYRKGSVRLYGLPVKIEQPRNSYRIGTDKNGTRWSCRLAANYGYFAGTKGNDGDPVDCFIGTYPNAEIAFVINQFVNGKFDEHKVMIAFVDEQEAINAYQLSYSRGWQGLHSLVPVTIKQLKWWLKNGNMQKPLSPENLPNSGFETMNKRVQWGDDNLPENMTLDQVAYEIRRADADDRLLFDAVTMADIYGDSEQEVMTLDSLSVPFVALEREAKKIKLILNRVSKKLKIIDAEGVENPQVSSPIKKNGAIHIAVIYELSDGQTITIFFYNPDNDPSKLKPNDTMLAWKWLLNKKDITIVVAPERGKDVAPKEIATRVMNLAEKNSAAFTKANANRAAKMQEIQDLNNEIGSLEGELKIAQGEYEVAKQAFDEREIAKATEPKAPFVPTHTVDDDGEQVPVKRNEDGEFESENGTIYEEDDLNEFVPVGGNSVQSTGLNIDPATLANLNAASISAAIRKKAIAFFEKNPSAKSFEGSGLSKDSQKKIIDSIKTALFSEIKALSPIFKDYMGTLIGGIGNNDQDLTVRVIPSKTASTGYIMSFTVKDKGQIFDSTATLEDLRDWGFALPFDLDVHLFVQNVIKPVVDEFLSKQTMQNQDPNELQKNLPKNTIAGDSNDIANLAEKIIANEIPANEKQAVRYAVVTDAEAEKIKQKTGLDVAGYKHTVDSFGIRHAIASHGDEKEEALRGQEAITAADMAKIPEIVSNPDNIEPGGESATGNDLIRYSKRFNGSIYYVEEVREGRMELVAITMWKTRTDVVMPDNQPNNRTSEVTGGNLPHDGESIDPLAQNATRSFDAEIETLRGLIGNDQFQTALDNLLDKLEAAGVDSQYEQVVGDIMNQHAEAIIAAAKGA